MIGLARSFPSTTLTVTARGAAVGSTGCRADTVCEKRTIGRARYQRFLATPSARERAGPISYNVTLGLR